MNSYLLLVLLTFAPGLELRAGIPVGIAGGIPWWQAFLLGVVANIIIGVLVWWALELLYEWFMRFKWFSRLANRYVEHVRRQVHKATERWGAYALAAFIAVPLPGSGVYSGALASQVLDTGFWPFFWACVAGVIVAGVIVTAASVLGIAGWAVAAR